MPSRLMQLSLSGLLVIFISLSVTQSVSAQAVTFTPGAAYASGGYEPYSVIAADVNGDGKLDLLVANVCANTSPCGEGTVAVLLGNGDGTFRPAVTYNTGGHAYSVVAGDLNGDGKLDLVVATYLSSDGSTGTVGVLLGNGDGTFQPVVTYGSGGKDTHSVVLADVNRDGKLDVLVANSCDSSGDCLSGTVGVLLGNGDGTFQPAVSYNSGGYLAYSVAVADVNGDGKPDLLIGNYNASQGDPSGTVGVLLGNGDGTFQPVMTYGSGGYYASSVVVADVNGDSKPDLLVGNDCTTSSNCTSVSVGVLLGNGDGTFQPAVATSVPGNAIGSIGPLALADYNEDGKLDVASGVGGFLLLGNGDGTFQSPIMLESPSFGIAAGDFNNDGSPDLALAGVSGRCLNIIYPSCATVQLNTTFGTLPNTITITSSVTPSSYNQAITLTATVPSRNGVLPTGTVTFFDGAQSLGNSNLNSSGVASFAISTLAIGTHSLSATYNGDSHYGPSSTPSLTQVVNQATTATALVSSADPIAPNQSVTYTATVTNQYGGATTGTVNFKDGNIVTKVPLAGGTATFTETYTLTGTHFITATYSGDSNNVGSTSTLTEYVAKLPVATKTVITTSGSPSLVTQPVTFTATVTSNYGSIPNGETVNFYDGAKTLGTGTTAAGVASLTTSSLSAATHTIQATYVGDATFASSSGVVKQVVDKYSTTTALTSSLNPSNYGQSVTLTAQVTTSGSTAPTGTVTFYNGSTSLGTGKVNANGIATLSKTTLPVGSDSLTAFYGGDSLNGKSTSHVLTQTVNQAQIMMTLTSSPNPANAGQSVKFTATLTSNGGLPTGTVTFSYNGSTLGTGTISAGKATFSSTALPIGSDVVTVSYPGNTNYSSASASATQTVN